MEALADQNLDEASISCNLLGVKFQPLTHLSGKDGLFSNCVKIVKPRPLTHQCSYNNDDQTFNRQKVSRLDVDTLSSQPEVGQILNVQVKSQEKNITILNGIKGIPGFCVPHECSNPFAPSRSTVFQRNFKPKTQEISKVIQDITEDWNSDKEGRSKKAHRCRFDKEVSEADMQVALFDANSNFLEKGTFGSAFTSAQKPSLVVKKTAHHVNPNEILVPLRLKGCPNIVQIHAVDVHSGMFCIVQEHCGASLKMLVRQENFLNYFRIQTKRHNFIEGMFKGVEVLEKSRACHGDLKLENICARLENDTYVPRLIDFGTCQASSDKPSLEGISPEFLPPRVNSFALQVIERCIKPEQQGMLLFDEKSDSWSVAMVTICLWQRGLHPIKEVQAYVKFDLPERIVAMRTIAQLTDNAVDDIVPSDLDPVMKIAVRENLRVSASQRWGAKSTVEYFRQARLREEGSMLSRDGNLKRGTKRPVSPFHPSPTTVSRNEDDVSELMDLFKSFQKKKPPDDIIVPRVVPSSAGLGESVNPKYFAGKDPATKTPEKRGGFISTLKFKPDQQALEEVRGQREEIINPLDDLSHTISMKQPPYSVPGISPLNIPDIMKLEAVHSHDHERFKIKAAPQKVIQPEDEAPVVVTSSSVMPDFGLLGMDWDMNNEPPAQNPTRVIGKTSRRRSNTKAKSFFK